MRAPYYRRRVVTVTVSPIIPGTGRASFDPLSPSCPSWSSPYIPNEEPSRRLVIGRSSDAIKRQLSNRAMTDDSIRSIARLVAALMRVSLDKKLGMRQPALLQSAYIRASLLLEARQINIFMWRKKEEANAPCTARGRTCGYARSSLRSLREETRHYARS